MWPQVVIVRLIHSTNTDYREFVSSIKCTIRYATDLSACIIDATEGMWTMCRCWVGVIHKWILLNVYIERITTPKSFCFSKRVLKLKIINFHWQKCSDVYKSFYISESPDLVLYVPSPLTAHTNFSNKNYGIGDFNSNLNLMLSDF